MTSTSINSHKSVEISNDFHEINLTEEELNLYTVLTILSDASKPIHGKKGASADATSAPSTTAAKSTAAPATSTSSNSTSTTSANTNTTNNSTGSSTIKSQLEQAIVNLIQLLQTLQISNAKKQNFLSNLSLNLSQSSLSQATSNQVSATENQIKIQQEEAAAERKSKIMNIIGWVVTAVVALASIATGNFAMAFMAIALQVASSVQIPGLTNSNNPSGTILGYLTSELASKLGSNAGAQAIMFAAILVVSCLVGNPENAPTSLYDSIGPVLRNVVGDTVADAVDSVVQAVKNILSKVAEYTTDPMNDVIKNISKYISETFGSAGKFAVAAISRLTNMENVMMAGMYSGFLQTVLQSLAQKIAPNNQNAQMAITIVLTLILAISSLKTGKPGESVFSKFNLGSISETANSYLTAAKDFLKSICETVYNAINSLCQLCNVEITKVIAFLKGPFLQIVETGLQGAQSGLGIQAGMYQITESNYMKEQALNQELATIFTGLQTLMSNFSTADQKISGSVSQQEEQTLTNYLSEFQMFSSEANAAV